jgi:leader peptidase (prepilin peptidase) / N-methyltransferase
MSLLTIMPTFSLWWGVVAFLYGVIIGSFLNVYIYRFHTGKSLSGHSHCLSCAKTLRWFELFPLVSYVFLRGRCKGCGSYIPIRYFLVEFTTGVLFVFALFKASSLIELLLFWFLLAVIVVIAVYDLRHYIIPDSLTLTITVTAFLWYLYLYGTGTSPEALVLNIVAAIGGAGFFFLLWFISKGQWMGFGDVKLVFPLSLMVGSGLVFSMIVLSFWVGAGVSVGLICLQRYMRGKLHLRFFLGNLTIKSVVPFAPFLIAGCLLVFFTHFDVLALFTF